MLGKGESVVLKGWEVVRVRRYFGDLRQLGMEANHLPSRAIYTSSTSIRHSLQICVEEHVQLLANNHQYHVVSPHNHRPHFHHRFHQAQQFKMSNYFRINLIRSAIGMPKKTQGVLKALGLRKRLRTVYHPVSPDVAGQIFAVKELVDVQEVDQALTKTEMKDLRKPDPGFYVEKRAMEARGD